MLNIDDFHRRASINTSNNGFSDTLTILNKKKHTFIENMSVHGNQAFPVLVILRSALEIAICDPLKQEI